ncbi:hypothetical protein J6590_080399 [Homalodisca vitripennis]|nr:hypothetical protein J6590_080399 [Homalodisca vitripennis]
MSVYRVVRTFCSGGGSIREAGGAFAEMQKAKEDQYFYNLQKNQLQQLKEDSKRKIKYHRDEIEKHEQAIRKEEDKYKDRQG